MGPAQPDRARPAETLVGPSIEFIAKNGGGAGSALAQGAD
jgi:hypothetical protein